MIKKCLFPVAGYGTRFLPATKAMPKEMLPILNKPLIQYGVEEVYAAGMHRIAFVTGRGKRAIEDHFDIAYELEHEIMGSTKEHRLDGIRDLREHCTFTYTRQREMRGLGDAILTGDVLIGNEPFGVVLADDLCVGDPEPIMSQMMEIYREHQCSVVAVEEVEPRDTDKYGVIAGTAIDERTFRVSDMVEKPDPEQAPSNL
ncbi:MAG: sugar phosphate nucleotidyltransferase, partial [Chromatiales bacterium]